MLLSTDTMPIRTDAIPAPWLRPPVTNVHLNSRARLRRRRNRFAASAFARDLRHGGRRAAAILGCVAVVYAAIVILRGLFYVAWVFGAVQ